MRKLTDSQLVKITGENARYDYGRGLIGQDDYDRYLTLCQAARNCGWPIAGVAIETMVIEADRLEKLYQGMSD